MTTANTDAGAPLQPFLHDGIVVLRAPTQAWSRPDGDMGGAPIDGIFHGDTRFVREARLTVDGLSPEPIATTRPSASEALFTGLLRAIDDASADPKVRITRARTARDGEVRETITVASHVPREIAATLTLHLAFEFTPLHRVKAGLAGPADAVVLPHPGGASITTDASPTATLTTDGVVTAEGDIATVSWPLRLRPGTPAVHTWTVRCTDPAMVVRAAATRRPAVEAAIDAADPRAGAWARAAVDELDALRLSLPAHPEDEFFAAGAAWFFTLFGRDSLWAARLGLSQDWRVAASTLRVLARLQGTHTDDSTAEAPGKILHELRARTFEVPGEKMSLPPVYYGSVDATPLWVCVLADAWDHGMPDEAVRELIPALRGCLAWILGHGEDFLSYVDRSGHGLANQGWKDSGDSIQWRSGALAEGPIALCEVQGYAYEAAQGAARLLDAFGEPGGEEARAWAGRLRHRFRERFWVDTLEGRYPGIALDAHGHAVDALTSNIGHLLGTGILDPEEEAGIARLLVGPTMRSGYGIRTMSTQARGYWPLSYHGGSVWTHDTAIIARGLHAAGRHEEAAIVVEDLLNTAEGFDFHVPELHAGDPRSRTPRPIPYPAACRPQAWSAAAALTVLDILEDASIAQSTRTTVPPVNRTSSS